MLYLYTVLYVLHYPCFEVTYSIKSGKSHFVRPLCQRTEDHTQNNCVKTRYMLIIRFLKTG